MLPRRLLGPLPLMGCPGVVVEAVVSAGLTNAEPFEGQCGVGGPFGGPLARLPPPSHFQVRVVSELGSWLRGGTVSRILD